MMYTSEPMKQGYFVLMLALTLVFAACRRALPPERIRVVQYQAGDTGTKSKEGYLCDGLECGDWVFYSQDGSVFEKGTMENGMKIGKWVTYCSDQAYTTDWVAYNDTVWKISLSYPGYLSSIRKDRFMFDAVDTANSSHWNDRLIVSVHELRKSGVTLRDFHDYYIGTVGKDIKATGFRSTQLRIGTDTCYKINFLVPVDSAKTAAMYVFLQEKDGIGYEFSFTTEPERNCIANMLFLSVVQSFRYKGERNFGWCDELEVLNVQEQVFPVD